MLVTLLPIVTLVRLLQSQNAHHPMSVTLSGMYTDVSAALSAKARAPMDAQQAALLRGVMERIWEDEA